MNELEKFIESKFGVNEKVFLEIFRNSPGAEGYLLGAVGEQLFKQYAESKGFGAPNSIRRTHLRISSGRFRRSCLSRT